MSTCNHPQISDGCTTGYAVLPSGERVCYDCAAQIELADLLIHGNGYLYLSNNCAGKGTWHGWQVSNWTGKICAHVVAVTRGRHNIARSRYDAWFVLPGDDCLWHGVNIGDSQILRCRRTKRSAYGPETGLYRSKVA